jgi:hypothetical protein
MDLLHNDEPHDLHRSPNGIYYCSYILAEELPHANNKKFIID